MANYVCLCKYNRPSETQQQSTNFRTSIQLKIQRKLCRFVSVRENTNPKWISCHSEELYIYREESLTELLVFSIG